MSKKPKYTNIVNWSIVTSERCLLVYTLINGKTRITKYKISTFETYDQEFKIKVTSNQYNNDNDDWKSCNLIITCKINDHSYLDSRESYTYDVPVLIGSRDNFLPHATFINVKNRLKSI